MAPSPKKKAKNSKLTRTEKVQNNPVPTTNFHPGKSSVIRSISIVIITLFGLNLARICCISALHPLFGSVASNYTFEIGVQTIDFLIAPIINFLCPNLSPSPTASNLLTAFLVWRAPDSFGRILSKYSSRFHILRGPFIFQLVAYWPARLAGMSTTYQLIMELIKQLKPIHDNKVFQQISIVLLPLALHGVSRLMIPLANTFFKSIPPSQIFNLTPPILLAITVISSIIEISKLKLKKTIVIKKVNMIILLGCIMSALYMPLPMNLSHELDLKSKSSTGNYRTLARRLSVTGLVLVGEFTQESGSQFRFLRCDHSLLGGIWNGLAKKDILRRQMHSSFPITTDELNTQSIEEAEAIYPTFILQTAVRLVQRSQNNFTAANDKPKALILGLGVGISARILMKLDVVVTIVEIDPLVYEYSKKYFGLPNPKGGIFLEDARIYLNRKGETKSQVFDYVIHDVFTGGAVPSSLFTLECWQEIRVKLKDDGVLAVNFVGRPLSDAASMVLATLFKIFPFCRAFSENSGGPISETDYQNMVIFCSPTGKPKFSKVEESDISGLSEYKLTILNSFQNHEIDLTKIISSQRKKDENVDQNERIILDKNQSQLDRAQAEVALHHWEIMRQALPDAVWNNYYD